MKYRHRAIAQLEAELAYTPPRLRVSHLERLASLLPELLPEKLYAYEYLFQRITGFQTDVKEVVAIAGSDLRRDLGLLLRRVSLESPLASQDPADPMLALASVAGEFHVTPGTVKRWALDGLPMAYRLDGDQRVLSVRKSLLTRFLAGRRETERKATKRLDERQRKLALERATHLLDEGAPQARVVRTLAAECSISISSARRLLRRGVAEQASTAADQGQAIAKLFRQGIPVRQIAQRFKMREQAVYTLLHDALVQEVTAQKIACIPSPEFAATDAESVCLGEDGLMTYLPEPTEPLVAPPDGLPPYLAELYAVPLLSREREAELFRKYNYLKHRLAMLQARLRKGGYHAALMEQFEEWRQAAEQARSVLIRCNLRLVVSIAKRHIGPLANLGDLISEGNLCLMRAVECYDYRREARFATYATWAISKHYARVVPEENYRLAAFVTGQQERLNATGDLSHQESQRREVHEHVRTKISEAVGRLTAREREVIAAHYGTDGRPARTLEEIGRAFGVTRERIRQIEARALDKLRDMVSPELVEGLA